MCRSGKSKWSDRLSRTTHGSKSWSRSMPRWWRTAPGRPVAARTTTGEKKGLCEEAATAAAHEIGTAVVRLLEHPGTLAEAEAAIRAAVGKIGTAALRTVLQGWVDREDAVRATPPGMAREGRRSRWVRSLWGDFQIRRAYYTGPEQGRGEAPADRLLGLWRSYTPAMARMLCTLSAQMPFEAAAQLLADMTGASVNGRQFHRFTAEAAAAARAWIGTLDPPERPVDTLYIGFDGTGVPMRKEHLVGRKGRGKDGRARTREMRLGCVFTQTGTDRDGNPVRDEHSTSYVAALLPHRLFGRMLKAEAVRRGLRQAARVVLITDGAKWCETVAEMFFPGLLHILDFYHAAEHVQQLANSVFGEDKQAQVYFRLWRRKLYAGKAKQIIQQARSRIGQAHHPEDLRRETAYLEHNLKRMHYDAYRKQGLFVGSGVIEAGCKTVVAQRAKQSGMLWGTTGVQDVLTLRCLMLSGRMCDFLNHAQNARRAS